MANATPQRTVMRYSPPLLPRINARTKVIAKHVLQNAYPITNQHLFIRSPHSNTFAL